MALLERLVTEAPVVLVFEDLHWTDPATLRAIRAIGRALLRLPVALLVTLRSPAELAFRHELMREAIYHDLALPLRQGIHREVARVVTAAGVPAVRLADHLFLADGDVVVAWLDYAATVKSTGRIIEGPLVHWFTLRDGKVASFDEFEHETHDGWT